MIDTIAIGQADGDTLTVTMRGDAEQLVKVLTHGLPYEAMLQLQEAIIRELAVRRSSPSVASSDDPSTR